MPLLQDLVAGTPAPGSASAAAPQDAELEAIARKQGKSVQQLLAETPGTTPEEKAFNAKQAAQGVQSLDALMKAEASAAEAKPASKASPMPTPPAPRPAPLSSPEDEGHDAVDEAGWLRATDDYYKNVFLPERQKDNLLPGAGEEAKAPVPEAATSQAAIAAGRQQTGPAPEYKAPEGPNIEDMVKMFQAEEAQIRGPIRQEFAEKRHTLEQQIADARKAAESSTNRNEWGQVAERIGHALAQFGAGLHGERTGVDMSGLKFNKIDWERRLDRIQAGLSSDLNRMETKAGRLDSDERLKTKEATQVPKEVFDSRVKDAMTQYRAKLDAEAKNFDAKQQNYRDDKRENFERESDATKYNRVLDLEAARIDGRREIAGMNASKPNKAEAAKEAKAAQARLQNQKRWDADNSKLAGAVLAASQGDAKSKVKALSEVQRYGTAIGLTSEDLNELTEAIKDRKSGLLGMGDNRKETDKKVRDILKRAPRPDADIDALDGRPASEPGASPTPAAPQAKPLAPNEVIRVTADGRSAVFDSTTRKFLRYAD